MTRAFVALQLPHAVLDAVEQATAAVEIPDGRRTAREQWHITLQFLGNRADVDEVAAALLPLDTVAARVRVGGAGAFPDERRARVLWLGIAEGAEWIARVAERVTAQLLPLGFEPEARAFHPHLTVARARQRPVDWRDAVAMLGRGSYGPSWTVSEIVVYESRLRRSGAEYVPRAAITLPG